jgi:hypothetical protein
MESHFVVDTVDVESHLALTQLPGMRLCLNWVTTEMLKKFEKVGKFKNKTENTLSLIIWPKYVWSVKKKKQNKNISCKCTFKVHSFPIGCAHMCPHPLTWSTTSLYSKCLFHHTDCDEILGRFYFHLSFVLRHCRIFLMAFQNPHDQTSLTMPTQHWLIQMIKKLSKTYK